MRSLKADIRNSARPGSQAPHAPPALTFGLTGKQRVKQVPAGCVLIRLLGTLPRNRNIFINRTSVGSPLATAQDSSLPAVEYRPAANPDNYG
jgi:hypothetical protein